jgi:hypothetical protein
MPEWLELITTPSRSESRKATNLAQAYLHEWLLNEALHGGRGQPGYSEDEVFYGKPK